MPETKATVDPVRKSVAVKVAPARAFEFFTREIGRWWPLATHSVGLEEADNVSFGSAVGDQLVETGVGGTKAIWGTVLRSEPPHRIAFSWHPGRSGNEATLVEVTFTPDADGGTVVELVHSGWERWADGEAQAENYRQGWNPVLSAFADRSRDG
jgi:uncharacterized protein YndB with AHSA1/START domain